MKHKNRLYLNLKIWQYVENYTSLIKYTILSIDKFVDFCVSKDSNSYSYFEIMS